MYLPPLKTLAERAEHAVAGLQYFAQCWHKIAQIDPLGNACFLEATDRSYPCDRVAELP